MSGHAAHAGRLTLCSASIYRRRLLGRLGLDFVVCAADIDEEAWKSGGRAPRAVAHDLAEAKAAHVESALRHEAEGPIGPHTLIASDQVAALGARILDKPGTHEGAREQLAALSGRTHTLWTAVCLVHLGASGRAKRVTWVDETRMTMRALDEGEIQRYVERDEPVDCAGSYKVEELGVTLFERIDTEDATAIEGLPLLRLAKELRELGFSLP